MVFYDRTMFSVMSKFVGIQKFDLIIFFYSPKSRKLQLVKNQLKDLGCQWVQISQLAPILALLMPKEIFNRIFI